MFAGRGLHQLCRGEFSAMNLLTLFFLFGLGIFVIAGLALVVVVDFDVVLKLLLTRFVVPALKSGHY